MMKSEALFPRRMALLPANNAEFTIETRDLSPAHLLIKLESFSLLSKHGISKFESREFEAGDYKWKLLIYTDGDESEKEGDHISVYLSMVGTSSLPVDWEVNATFSVFLLNQILDKYTCFRGNVRRFHAMNSKWGFSKLISKKRLTDPSNGYVVENNCVFGAEVFVIKSQRVIECVSLLQATNLYKQEWLISKISKLVGAWSSEQFSAEGYQWKIKLYPNGNGSGKGRSVSIFIECVDSKNFAPHQRVKADICMRIKNKLRDTHLFGNFSQWFSSSKQVWGYSEFISIDDMRNRVVIDDCCILETEISIQARVRDAPEPE